MAPQLTWIALMMLGLGISLANHGKPGKPTNFFIVLLAVSINASILYWGGFFEPLIK